MVTIPGEPRPDTTGLRIEAVGYTHPDAARLIAEVQQEYVRRYGSHDASPVDPGEFDPPRGLFVVAYRGAEPVGTGAWRERRLAVLGVAEAPGACVEVKRMYVAPGARGLGVARRVLAHLEATAAAAGASVIVLETGTAQPEAIALYTSSGYEPVPGFGHYRDSPLSRCFGKRLG